jgi:polar amino acid transport system substrate-binding protein
VTSSFPSPPERATITSAIPGTILRPLVLTFVLAASLFASLAHAQQDVAPAIPPVPEEGTVVVPNFWDPRARIERPSADEIGAIRFLTTDDFPPFSFRDRRGILVGFDIDLAEAICEVLKVQCAVQTRPFDTLIGGLKDGTGNAILAGYDLERASSDGFIASQAYLKIPGRFVVKKDSTFDPGPPPPKGFVGAVCNSAHAAYLARFFPDIHVACFMKPGVPLDELKNGRLDAVFGDALSLSFWLNGPQSTDCCRFAGGAYLDDRYFGPGLAIVMKAEDRALKAALDYALREVYRAGTYEELYLRYFPVGLY